MFGLEKKSLVNSESKKEEKDRSWAKRQKTNIIIYYNEEFDPGSG